ncbi:MAG: aldolase [Candidatus Woesearchaeota archaeon]|jgi:fructose-bisphosphate aldolase/6-deoxy-5-ketofructose 1-phosphate synthase|nr:aldolase [Candidatus Woesearchaeota archaeon]|tara:strand:- start:406 stop:1362 length:957 start_codon:yes stop_codon:yes gene_type:complete
MGWKMKTLSKNDVLVPADVPGNMKDEYTKNFLAITHNTGRLMLFAGDQKIEHLNDDFYGSTKLGPIPADCNDPEHLFKIAGKAKVGVLAAQFGLISKYGLDYKKAPYLVKLNSKTHLVGNEQKDPLSEIIWTVDDVVEMKKNSGLNILGVGYTIYSGSEFEGVMMREAAQVVNKAHKHGLIVVLWMYPRGKAVGSKHDELTGHMVAGAAGVGACLGTDFVKVNYPKEEGKKSEEIFKEAIGAAGRTGVITSGGSSKDPKSFLQDTWNQLHVSGAVGNATGRNIHQKALDEAVRMANAVFALTIEGKSVDEAFKIYEGK